MKQPAIITVAMHQALARWQSGHAAACKAAYAGSIPTLASIANKDSGAPGRLFLWLEVGVGAVASVPIAFGLDEWPMTQS